MSRLFLVIASVLIVFAGRAEAINCGDKTGPSGSNVNCSCGDTVTTTTKLNAADTVLSTGPADVCAGDGLIVASGVFLTLKGGVIRGSGGGITKSHRLASRSRASGFVRFDRTARSVDSHA